jgi:hypothetical protein
VIDRLLPQTNYYVQMKLEHLSYWQAEGFKGYRSPWMPVCEANEGLLARGDLILSNGFDSLHEIGRDFQSIMNGRTKRQRSILQRPDFVWVDAREHDVEPYLRENPYAEEYSEYSQLLEMALRTGERVLQDMRFPLFHKTSAEFAHGIVSEGIDFFYMKQRQQDGIGAAFYMTQDLKAVHGKGSLSGAVVAIVGTTSVSFLPRWLIQGEGVFTCYLDDFLRKTAEGLGRKQSYYSWRTACSELSAVALHKGENCICLYDFFEIFEFAEVDQH